MSFQIGLVILVIRNVQCVGTCVKCYFIHLCFVFLFCFLCILLLGFVIIFIIIHMYNYCIFYENLPYIGRCKSMLLCFIIKFSFMALYLEKNLITKITNHFFLITKITNHIRKLI